MLLLDLDLIRSKVTSLWKIGLSSRTGLQRIVTAKIFPAIFEIFEIFKISYIFKILNTF